MVAPSAESEIIAKLESILDTFARMPLSELRASVLEFRGDKWLLTYGAPTVELDIYSGDLIASWRGIRRWRIYPPITPADDCDDDELTDDEKTFGNPYFSDI